MQSELLCVSTTSELWVRLACHETSKMKPSNKIILLTIQNWCFFCESFEYVISGLFLLCFHALLFTNALWSPAGKELNSWLLFVTSNYVVVTFPLVSWVR